MACCVASGWAARKVSRPPLGEMYGSRGDRVARHAATRSTRVTAARRVRSRLVTLSAHAERAGERVETPGRARTARDALQPGGHAREVLGNRLPDAATEVHRTVKDD